MKEEDKRRLLDELDKFYKKNYKYGSLVSPELYLGSTVIGDFSSKKKDIFKILINNDYGLIGNLMYKYMLAPDSEVSEYIRNKDEELLNKAYDQFGSKIISINLLSNHLESMVSLIKRSEGLFDYVGSELKKDERFYLEIAKIKPHLLTKFTELPRKKRVVVLEACALNGEAYLNIPVKYKRDREVVLNTVKSKGRMLEHCFGFSNDEEVVWSAINNDGMALSGAADIFKDNEELVLLALNNNCWALQYASLRLRNKCNVVLKAVKENGATLCFAGPRPRDSKRIIMTAIKNDPYSLAFASKRLKEDKEIALIAVSSIPMTYKYIGENLKMDSDILSLLLKEEVDRYAND